MGEKVRDLKVDGCENCRFWREWSALNEDGDCVRYPPIVVVTAEGDTITGCPETHYDFWCGEYQPGRGNISLRHD